MGIKDEYDLIERDRTYTYLIIKLRFINDNYENTV